MKITLKDGSCKEYQQPMSVYEIAADISEGLARVATAGEIERRDCGSENSGGSETVI